MSVCLTRLVGRCLAIGSGLLLACSGLRAQQVLFFDDFNGTNSPLWQEAMPDALLPVPGYTAKWIGFPSPVFEHTNGVSFMRLTHTLSDLTRRGWILNTNFSEGNFRYEVRFNTLNQVSSESIDAFIELWVFDAADSNRYDLVGLFGGSRSTDRRFCINSSIDHSGVAQPFDYANQTYYRLVLEGNRNTELRGALLSDDGTELASYNFGHNESSFPAGFRIGLSQAVGIPYTPSPVDVAVDYAELTTSNAAPAPPTVLVQPADQTIAPGNPVTFAVRVNGTRPLSYQWWFNETNAIADATNSTFTIPSVQLADAGSYSVVVTNGLGSAVSSNALLTVEEMAPTITAQPQDRAAQVGSSTSFSVSAAGSLPLYYQWRVNETNLIPDATNSSYTIDSVQSDEAGLYSVVVSNLVGSTVSSNAALTVTYPPAVVRASSVTQPSGHLVLVPITLRANGNENALGFSLSLSSANWLTFDSVVLGSNAAHALLVINTNQLPYRVGIALALPTGTTFPAGTQEVALVRFDSGVFTGTGTHSTVLGFTSIPTAQQLSSPDATVLPATYTGGVIALTPSDLEGDTTPRGRGDRAVAITDWVQVGRFVALLDTPANGGEFQRADCAPKDTRGDGVIKLTDWVQAGRYAAGLDPLAAAGGPTSEVDVATSPAGLPGQVSSASVKRAVYPVGAQIYPGQLVSVPVLIESQGDENALSFSLNYDAAAFTYAGLELGSNGTGLSTNVNTSEIGVGKLGVICALAPGSSFKAGTQELLEVKLAVSPAVAPGSYPITLGDQPMLRDVADSAANELSADYPAASLTVAASPALHIGYDSTHLTLAWPISASDFTLQTLDQGKLPDWVWTNISGVLQTNGGTITVTMPMPGEASFYRLYRP